MGYAKWDRQKEVSQASQTSFCVLVRGSSCGDRSTADARQERGCPELSLPIPLHLYYFMASISSPISMLFSYRRADKPLVPMTNPAAIHSVHTLCRPAGRDRSQPRNEHSATHSHLCSPPPDLPLLPCTPFGAVCCDLDLTQSAGSVHCDRM